MEYKDYCDNIDTILNGKKADMLLVNGSYLNFFTGEVMKANILINNGIIVGIGDYNEANEIIDCTNKIIAPSFIDAHVHLESTLLSPKNFAKLAVAHGTGAVITDPHEIANVRGVKGIEFMLEETKDLPLDAFIMAPSCVPATFVPDNYGHIKHKEIKELYKNPRVLGLAEMMNYPGVIYKDEEVFNKINISKIVDGHAPLLSGRELDAYIAAGVENDHECSKMDEALEKLSKGMYILIREGTAAHNLEALAGLIKYPTSLRCMFATDDLHADHLYERGHIDYIIKKAISYGVKPIDAFMCATYIPSIFYNLKDRGSVSIGKKANLIVIDSLENINISHTINNGKVVYNGKLDLSNPDKNRVFENTFSTQLKTIEDFKLTTQKTGIEITPGELLTKKFTINHDEINDLAYCAVFERYHDSTEMAMCYVKGYDISSGAIATSVAHDSHNIIVIGKNKDDMCLAVNTIIKMHGGMVIANNGSVLSSLKLDIGGLMSSDSIENVIDSVGKMKTQALELGVSKGIDPFMNLSFIALPVIPDIKITSRGVFDVIKFDFLDE